MGSFDETLESATNPELVDESERRFWSEAPRYSLDRIASLAPQAPRREPSLLRNVLTKGLFACALMLIGGLLVIEAQAASAHRHAQAAVAHVSDTASK